LSSRDEVINYSLLDDLKSSTLIKKRDKTATDFVMKLINNLSSIKLSTQNFNRTSNNTHHSKIVLESDTTSAIVSASKKRDLIITTALHAALIVALQQVTFVSFSSFSKYTI